MESLKFKLAGFLMLAFLFSILLPVGGCSTSQNGATSPVVIAEQEGLQEDSENPAQGEVRKTAESTVRRSAGPKDAGGTAPGLKLLVAAVTKIVDGDTAYMRVGGRTEKVRFIGVDTPEIESAIGKEPYGREASEFTKRNLAGRKVYLELDIQERDKYGRLLAYVWLEVPKSDSESEVRTMMFNARLLLDGYAQVMTVIPNIKYAEVFLKFQREARDKGKGLWS